MRRKNVVRFFAIALVIAAVLPAGSASATTKPPAPFFSPSHVKICTDFTGSGKCANTPLDSRATINNSNPPWRIVGTKHTCNPKFVAWLSSSVGFTGTAQTLPAGTHHCDAIDYTFAVPNTPYSAKAKLTVEYTVFLPLP
jgi:hypothetical protein